jgi:hypothetical protein
LIYFNNEDPKKMQLTTGGNLKGMCKVKKFC